MGKTPKPLRILVHPALAEWPEWATLISQGHQILWFDEIDTWVRGGGDPVKLEEFDLIIAPNSWHMTELHKDYLDLAIKSARSLRYPTKSKKKEK
jgi:hypothetical protein